MRRCVEPKLARFRNCVYFEIAIQVRRGCPDPEVRPIEQRRRDIARVQRRRRLFAEFQSAPGYHGRHRPADVCLHAFGPLACRAFLRRHDGHSERQGHNSRERDDLGAGDRFRPYDVDYALHPDRKHPLQILGIYCFESGSPRFADRVFASRVVASPGSPLASRDELARPAQIVRFSAPHAFIPSSTPTKAETACHRS
jgi:hypothetical protein